MGFNSGFKGLTVFLMAAFTERGGVRPASTPHIVVQRPPMSCNYGFKALVFNFPPSLFNM